MTQNEFDPYVGPRPFERKKEDAARFFGRSQETDEIVSLIFGHPVLLVYAQSGAGKTSLFNASVTLKLEENGFDVLPLTRVGGGVPKGVAVQEIKNLYVFNALLKMDSETDPRTLLSKSLSTFLEKHNRTTDEDAQPRPRVIVFDQFEELFTYTPKQWREQREEFFLQVVEALNADPLLRVVFVIREDFLAELDPYARILPERLRTRCRLERLGENAALHAVKDPLADTSRKFARGVAEELVKELLPMRVVDATGRMMEVEGKYVEPVQLQVVCVTLWSSLEEGVTVIQHAHLKNFNVDDALSDFYKSAIESAVKETGVEERKLRSWFGKVLITPMGTRSTVFHSDNSTGGIDNSAVDFLEGHHIIRAEFRAGARWYELTHDRLVDPILENNRKWNEENSSPFRRQAEAWKESNEKEREIHLLSDAALPEADRWAKQNPAKLTDIDREFLEAGKRRQEQKEEEEQQKREVEKQKLEAAQKLADEQALSAKRARRFTMLALSLTVIAIVAAMFAFSQSAVARAAQQDALNAGATAQSNANAASTARANAESANAIAQAASTLAVENQKAAEKAADQALSGSLAAQAESLKNKDHALALLLALEAYQRQDTLLKRTTLFQVLQFSPYVRLFGFDGQVGSIAVSPDGKWSAVSASNQISLMDANTHQIVYNISGSDTTGGLGFVQSLAFNYDGTLLAAGGCVPDGCEARAQITIWDMRDPEKPVLWNDVSNLHTQQVRTLAFSPDGKYLATGSYDQTIILWDVSAPNNPHPIGKPLKDENSRGQITSLAFSPDGNTLVSGSDDQSLHLRDVSDPINVVSLGTTASQHTGTINSIAFGPLESRKFASASDDNTVVLWDWNLDSRSLMNPQKLEGHDGFVRSVAFNAQGTVLASAGSDGMVILWNAQTGEQLGPALRIHLRSVNAVAFGRSGTQDILFSGSSDQTLIVWDLSTRQPLSQPIVEVQPPADVGPVANSGEVEARAEGQQIWLTGRSEPLTGHTGAVNTLRFSPQPIGERLLLASASDDQTVILWDVSNVVTADVFLKLEGFEGPVISAFFNADGQLITIANGRAARWIITPETWKALACEAANRNLTDLEWEQYLPGNEYRKTCENIP